MKNVPHSSGKLYDFNELLRAIKSANLIDIFSLRIETIFSKVLSAVEEMEDGEDKHDAFSKLLGAIEGTDLMDKFSSRMGKHIDY